jgi:hypothetical protein
MAYLQVIGVELPILNDTLEESRRDIGDVSQAFDGTLRRSRIAVKHDLKFETPHMAAADAFAWDQLIRGMGEAWRFDSNLYGSKGRTTSVTTGCSIDTTEKFLGAGCLKITSGNVFNVASIYPTATGCTVLVFRKATATGGSTGFTHFICTEDSAGNNAYWSDGAGKTTGSLPSGIAISSGAVALSGYSAATRYWDCLVILPFVIPDAWASQLYTHAASNSSPLLPQLTLTGDVLWEGSSRTALGQSDTSKVHKAVVDGTFVTTARTLSVSLQQI